MKNDYEGAKLGLHCKTALAKYSPKGQSIEKTNKQTLIKTEPQKCDKIAREVS